MLEHMYKYIVKHKDWYDMGYVYLLTAKVLLELLRSLFLRVLCLSVSELKEKQDQLVIKIY